MATITLSITPVLTRREWKTPQGLYEGPMPRAELIFRGAGTIAALGAGDETFITNPATLPSGFVYRIVEAHVEIRMPSLADLNHFERGMNMTVSENQVEAWRKTLWKQDVNSGNTTAMGYAWTQASITNNFQSVWSSLFNDFGTVIDASQGVSIVLLQAVDDAPTSNAGTYNSYLRIQQYTVQQFYAYPMHSPTPIIQPV